MTRAISVPSSAAFFALAIGVLLVANHPVLAGLAAAAPLVVVTLIKLGTAIAGVPRRSRMVGTVCLLLLASTFVWRTRTTQALDANPLDAAGLVRVALVMAAGLCALVFLSLRRFTMARIPTSLRFLGAYIVTAAIAALDSPLPLQALYRAFELAVGFVAMLVALVLLEERAAERIMRLTVSAIGVIVAIVWVEAIVFPSHAWSPTASIVHYELQGYLPSYSTNAVGTLGALLAIWGLARTASDRRGALLARVALVGGLTTLLASQYRTGIVGFVVASVLVTWQRRRLALMLAAVLMTALLAVVGLHHAKAQAEAVFSKGRPELLASLDSRTTYWATAQPVIRQRPLLGWGLNVGSRRVLVALGDNTTSTIHSTWFEALLGTGLIGTSFLAMAFLWPVRRAWRVRRHPLGAAVLGMLVLFVVRSLTGTTTEIFDYGFLVFAALAFAAEQLAAPTRELSAICSAQPQYGGRAG